MEDPGQEAVPHVIPAHPCRLLALVVWILAAVTGGDREREINAGYSSLHTTEEEEEKEGKKDNSNHMVKEMKEWARPFDQPLGFHQLDGLAIGLGDLHDLVHDECALVRGIEG